MSGRRIREELTCGIDLGIGSCGWAVVRQEESGGGIVAMGARTFDVPETDKERTPTNQLRRKHRGLRTVLRRRRQRMTALRQLFQASGLLAEDRPGALRITGLHPWELRAEALDRPLHGNELAVALGHIAKHRGFRSNSKRDRGSNAVDESSKMLKTIEATRERSAQWRTVGEMFAKDPEYRIRKRNRDGDYTRSILRLDQEREVTEIFASQRRKGNRLATEELERTFVDLAFSQRPLADSEDKVGFCPFEPDERRAAKHAYSFELFRLLSRLAALTIRSPAGDERTLSQAEISAATEDFGSQRGVTFKRLRKVAGLREEDRFDGLPLEDEGKRDVVARSGSAMPGSAALRSVLGDAAWHSLRAEPAKLDRIAFVLTFREDVGSIRDGLAEIGLPAFVLDALMAGTEAGEFGGFKGAGHISAKACRALLPHLARGLVYSRACTEAGYDHARRPATALEQVANPIARKALTEAIKQIRAIVEEHGLPGRFHIELARDVGKSKEERDEITRGIEKRNKERDRLRELFAEQVGRPAAGAEDMLRFELWREQNGRSLYGDRSIPIGSVVATDNSVQVDHILPWSRSGDDSFVNKTLCFASENQEKKGRTPFEWLGRDEQRWNGFVAAVEMIKGMKGRKKRNYVLKDAKVLEEKFRPRNLNDTRFATRLLADFVRRMYPDDGTVRSVARPGPLTDRLRRGWGIQDLKKGPDGKRISDDRHHALDALIVAATSQSALQRLTKAFQESEAVGAHRDFSNLAPPWPGFVEETRAKMVEVVVSRAERRRARGQGHAETIRQVKARDEVQRVYERKAVDKLTLTDLDRIKDADRNGALVDILRQWIERGKPANSPPMWKYRSGSMDDNGTRTERLEPIRKVRLETKKKADVLVREGAADRGEMARVDVFRKMNRKSLWEYFLVPVYPHQVANRICWPHPPNRAIQAHTPEEEWHSVLAPGFEFLWSLSSLSFIEVEKRDGTFIDGYFRGVDRSTGNISISPHHSTEIVVSGIGTRTLSRFGKFSIDRLGNRHEVHTELRTWHGVACT